MNADMTNIFMLILDILSILLMVMLMMEFRRHRTKLSAGCIYVICTVNCIQGLVSASIFAEMPGNGAMPGLTYLSEVVLGWVFSSLSVAIAILFTLYLVIKYISSKNKG